jgi:hypothetical protein
MTDFASMQKIVVLTRLNSMLYKPESFEEIKYALNIQTDRERMPLYTAHKI